MDRRREGKVRRVDYEFSELLDQLKIKYEQELGIPHLSDTQITRKLLEKIKKRRDFII